MECPVNPSYKNLKMKEMINSEIIHWIEEKYYLECELDNHFIYRMRELIMISIIIPCYNEEKNIHSLVKSLDVARRNIDEKLELI